MAVPAKHDDRHRQAKLNLCRGRSWLLIPIVLLGAEPVRAQRLAWNPTLSATVAYDSNVFAEAGSGREDWLGTLAIDVPVNFKPDPRFDALARFANVSERYRTFTQLDDPRARSDGRLAFRFEPQPRTEFRLEGTYRETNRPAEVFTDAGVELGRARTTGYGGSAGFTQGFGARSTLQLGYSYRYSEVTSLEDHVHSGNAALSVGVGGRTRLGVRGVFDRRFSETQDQFDSGAVLAAWDQEVSRRLSFSLSAGARFVESSDARPEAHATARWERGHWLVHASYARTLGYVPRRTDLPQRIGDSDRAELQVVFSSRRLRLAAGPTFYWTRNDTQDTRVWRALAEASFMPIRWLGLRASYSYLRQTGTVETEVEVRDVEGTRNVAHLGVVLAPWNRRGAESLP
jgi:hypothetical protein